MKLQRSPKFFVTPLTFFNGAFLRNVPLFKSILLYYENQYQRNIMRKKMRKIISYAFKVMLIMATVTVLIML